MESLLLVIIAILLIVIAVCTIFIVTRRDDGQLTIDLSGDRPPVMLDMYHDVDILKKRKKVLIAVNVIKPKD